MPYCGRIALLLCLALAGCATAPPEPPPDFAVIPKPQVVVVRPETIRVPPPPTSPPPPMATAPRPAANHLIDTWISLEHWSQTNGFGTPRHSLTEGTPAYYITASNGTLLVQIASKSARWNGLEFRLGFAPQMLNGHPYVHALDAEKNFEPLLDAQPAWLKTNRVLVIDPGHGGTDNGATSVYNGQFEKQYTLDCARRLRARLVTNGWTVFLTRTNDTFVALSNRVAFAEQHKADLFVSLHFNSAAPEEEQAGLETYCLTPAGLPSNLTRGYQDKSALVFPNNRFDAQNLQLAVRLHRALLQANGNLDRGIRRARFLGVLQGQNRPAVLVEGGYLSNPREAKQLADPIYREKLAQALAGALLEDSTPALNLVSHAPAASGPAGTNGKIN